MKQATVCPYCGTAFPLDKDICPNLCGAYRVDDDNYNLSTKERFGYKLKNKKVIKHAKTNK